MAGLVPAIHAAPLSRNMQFSIVGTAWMPGTSPGMTIRGCNPDDKTNLLSPDSRTLRGGGETTTES